MPWGLLLLIFIGSVLLLFSIHLLSNYFFEYFFSKKFLLLTETEKRSCQHEFTSTFAVIGIFVSFAIGAMSLHSTIKMSDPSPPYPIFSDLNDI